MTLEHQCIYGMLSLALAGFATGVSVGICFKVAKAEQPLEKLQAEMDRRDEEEGEYASWSAKQIGLQIAARKKAESALQVILDCVDYRNNKNCKPNQMVGAVLPIEILKQADIK